MTGYVIAPMTTKERQYGACFEEPAVTLGPMASDTYRNDPRRLGITLARYKFVAKMLKGRHVAEIGCGDGFGAQVVRQEVAGLDLYDFDPAWAPFCDLSILDITATALPKPYDAVYALDVLEHIAEPEWWRAVGHVNVSLLKPHGIFIAGCPSLESQAHASEKSKAGHVNCKSGERLRDDLEQRFHNVFLFSMSDEVVHTGFSPMAHYLLALCVGPR